MTDANEPSLDRRLLLLSAAAGMGAIVALPLSITVAWSTIVLIFSVPLVLALVGKLRARPPLIVAGIVVLAVVGAVLLLPIEFLGYLALVVLLAGPVVAIVLVGPPLREVDQVAAAAFLMGGTIAVITGFTTSGVSATGSAVAVVGVAVVSLAIVASRLARATRDA